MQVFFSCLAVERRFSQYLFDNYLLILGDVDDGILVDLVLRVCLICSTILQLDSISSSVSLFWSEWDLFYWPAFFLSLAEKKLIKRGCGAPS